VATSVQDRDVAAGTGFRLLVAASAGVQYVLVRRR